MSTAVYTRVSTKKQNDDAQTNAIEKWLASNDYDADSVEWYSDQESGGHTDRAALDALQADIFSGKVKTVIVWKLDRLARSQQDGINIICDWCDRGVRLVSITQQIDLSGAVGRLIAGVFFALGEIELGHIRERQRAGIEAAKAKNIYKGRKPGTVKASPERARELKDQGLKNTEIAQALGVKPRTVSRYLKKPAVNISP